MASQLSAKDIEEIGLHTQDIHMVAIYLYSAVRTTRIGGSTFSHAYDDIDKGHRMVRQVSVVMQSHVWTPTL